MAQEMDLVNDFLQASMTAERKRKRRTWAVVSVVFGVVVTLAVVATWFGFKTQQQASDLAVAATTDAQRLIDLSTAQAETEQERDVALSRQLAAQSENELTTNNYELALLLAIEAGKTANTREAFTALRKAFAHPGRALEILNGHSGWILQAKWNSKGNRILTASTDGTARIWDAETGKELVAFVGHTESIVYASWNSDERLVLTASKDRTVRVWNAHTGEELLKLVGHQGSVNYALWDANESRILSSGSDGTARIWDAESGKLLFILAPQNGVINQATWNAEENFILTIGCDQVSSESLCVRATLAVWNARTGDKVFSENNQTNGIHHADWHPVKPHLLIVRCEQFQSGKCENGVVQVWDVESKNEILRLTNFTSGVRQAFWSSDGTSILTADVNGTVQLWNAISGEELQNFANDQVGIAQIMWDANEDIILAVGCDKLNPFGRCLSTGMRSWSTNTGEKLFSITNFQNTFKEAIWNRDGTEFLSIHDDSAVRVWTAQEGKETATLIGHSGEINLAKWSPDGDYILTTACEKFDELRQCKESLIRIWGLQAKEEVPSIGGHPLGTNLITLNNDHSQILTVGCEKRDEPYGTCIEGFVRVWDMKSGRGRLTLTGFRYGATQARWDPEGGRILATGCEEIDFIYCNKGSIRIWDADSGKELLVLAGDRKSIIQASWSPDGTRVLSVGCEGTGWHNVCVESSARIWDAETGVEMLVLQGNKRGVRQANWSADGTRVLTSGCDKRGNFDDCVDGSVRVWNAQTGEILLTLNSQKNGAHYANWNESGDLILTVSCEYSGWACEESTVQVWDAKTGEKLYSLPNYRHGVRYAIWDPAGRRILTLSCLQLGQQGCIDSIVQVWDAYVGKELLTLSGYDSGTYYVSWIGSGEQILTSGCEQRSEKDSCRKNAIRIWDATTGTELFDPIEFQSQISHAIWDASRYRILITDGKYGVVRQFYGRIEDLITSACQQAPRNMTRDEWQGFMGDKPYGTTCPNLPVKD